MLIMSKAMGKTGKKVAMAAPPVILRCHIPQGGSELKLLPWMTFKHNIVEMDENADVTFGVKDYPPWVCSLVALPLNFVCSFVHEVSPSLLLYR